jgi:hypothetical protein
MAAHSLLICTQVLTPPALLLLALNIPFVSYRNNAARCLSAVMVAVSAVGVITTVKIKNPSLVFMTGLLEGWIVIWGAVLLIHYNPTVEARRLRWSRVPQHDGEYDEGGSVWQKYPQSDLGDRLMWTLDLLLSFRGVGWHFVRAGK